MVFMTSLSLLYSYVLILLLSRYLVFGLQFSEYLQCLSLARLLVYDRKYLILPSNYINSNTLLQKRVHNKRKLKFPFDSHKSPSRDGT